MAAKAAKSAGKSSKRKINRWRKLVRVLKRKWKKPALYTIAMSLVIYMVVGNLVWQKRNIERQAPRFVITRISSAFDETEFMHLLLTVQEINMLPKASTELIEFVNKPFPAPCPVFLENHLRRMNWTPTAFHIRVRKMFDMYEIYDHVKRLDDTIAFLEAEIGEKHLPDSALEEVYMLQAERERIFKEEMSQEEYEFVKEYGGIILSLKG